MTVFDRFLDELRAADPDCDNPRTFWGGRFLLLERLFSSLENNTDDFALTAYTPARRILGRGGNPYARLEEFDKLMHRYSAADRAGLH